jgi:hypothetical protein
MPAGNHTHGWKILFWRCSASDNNCGSMRTEVGSSNASGRKISLSIRSAAAAGVDLFVTNDTRLSGLVVPGITFITGIGRIPY